ncbi:LysR family transcriptional regulator [Cysteiniphilum sp. JM-1]|uniref:LysR family transcriptional regulator n=1 Tax=Cysteiniphilum sp. JM-1 TaxID=2610891 RepID=UPI001243B81E|nr:LysR family transcriptional regulator [Cysteiniphilum sp. JM-1]
MYTDFFTDATALLQVIKIGSISGAAEHTGEHRTTISRKIQRLEFHLKQNLISTKSGRIELTHFGQQFLPRLQNLIEMTNDSILELTNKSDSKNMKIRFFNNIGIYYFFGQQCIDAILQNHPNISVEMTSYTYYQMLNFGVISKALFDQFDVIFIHDSLLHLIDDEEWIVKLSLSTTHKLYASKKYLQHHSEIQSADDLTKHICIYNNLHPNRIWTLKETNSEQEIHLSLEQTIGTDAVLMQHKLVTQNYGIGLLPESIVKSENTDLINILPELSSNQFTTYMLINRESLKNTLIKDALSSVIDKLKTLDYWL